jgi:hypothetical protein
MDRPQKLIAVAEITLAGEQFQPSAEATVEMPAFDYGYNPELEKLKFEWMQRLQSRLTRCKQPWL